MDDFLQTLFLGSSWWSYVVRIAAFYLLAWVVHKLSNIRFGRIQSLWKNNATETRLDRIETTRRLISSFITILAFVLATIFSLSLFVSAESLLWVVGLFAGGFGVALMPLLRDIFTGITFLFEDAFDVGEKVEFATSGTIDGVVEHVNLRTTSIRARTGELYTVPNGEIRVVRNFSRGHFSVADVVISLDSDDLSATLDQLETAREKALMELPELIEPIQVVSETGHIGSRVELKLVAKARYGQAAALRPRLLAFVHRELASVGVDLSA